MSAGDTISHKCICWSLAQLLRGFWEFFEVRCTGATPVPSCLLQRTSRLLCHTGCITTTPAQQRHLQDMNESTQQEGEIAERARSGRVDETEFKWNKYDRLGPPDCLISGHLFKVGGNCAEKKRMFRDRQRKTSSVQTSPMEKRKTEHVARSCLNHL